MMRSLRNYAARLLLVPVALVLLLNVARAIETRRYGDVTATVEYSGSIVTGASRRVVCRFQDRRVTLIHERE